MRSCVRCHAQYAGPGTVCPSCAGRPMSASELRAINAGDTQPERPAPAPMKVTPAGPRKQTPSQRSAHPAHTPIARNTPASAKPAVTSPTVPLHDLAAPGTTSPTVEMPDGDIDPLIGQTPLGQYQIVRKLGEGGFGSAYLAEQIGIQRKAVIKVLHRQLLESDEVVRRFEREASVLASLDHHHIVRLYNFGVLDDGRLFLAMEYGGDKTLDHEIRQLGRLDADRALRIARQVCEALQEAHDHGVVHRDLKPANILIGHKGTQDWIKVVDVGIARIVEREESAPRLTRTGAVIGTPAYFSPEQARGLTVDGRSDLYSLGITIYEMLSGALPVKGATPLDFVRAHCVDPPTPLTRYDVNLPGFVEDVLFKALEKNPDDRYQSAAEMGEALGAALTRLHDPARGPARRGAAAKWALIGGLAAAGVVAVVFLQERERPVDVEVASVAEAPPPRPVPPPPQAPPIEKPVEQPIAEKQIERKAPEKVVARAEAAAPAGEQEALRLENDAERLAAAKDVKGAIAKFEEALLLQPGRSLTVRALRGLAVLYERTGDSELALKYYLRYRPAASASEKAQVDSRIAALRAELELESGR
jgi:tRNA A-37 threonylcarbamoyl transferase component Bud32